MKILVDECCPLSVVEALRENGHDVLYVAEDMRSFADIDILSQSVDEEHIILTEDRDFGGLVFRDAQPAYGIVLVRIDALLRQQKIARVRELFSTHAAELPHMMTTLTLNNTRVHPLPVPPAEE